jgi:hypothetical protein
VKRRRRLAAVALALVAAACGVPTEHEARPVPGARFVVPTTRPDAPAQK